MGKWGNPKCFKSQAIAIYTGHTFFFSHSEKFHIPIKDFEIHLASVCVCEFPQ